MIALLIAVLLVVLLEVVAFTALRAVYREKNSKFKTITWAFYWVWTVFVFGTMTYSLLNRGQFSEPRFMNTIFTFVGFWLMNFVSKSVIAFFYLFNQLTNTLYKSFSVKSSENSQAGRRQFITKTGLALASIPFAGLFYGMVKGKYQFKVWRQDLMLKNLPDSFVGKTIVQLSDMHLGSFPQDTDAVAAAIAKVNELEPDYIFFTGDMINERAIEAEPWVDTIKKLKAKFGKFSVLGNHDYGDYYEPWEDKPDKIEANIQHLKSLQEKMGFTLLRNENLLLTQGDESIRLIGLENWGEGFTQAGDMDKAMAGVADDEVQILLSHDPSHWDAQVVNKTKVDLALAGHTHGSQIGIELPILRLSPVQLRYARWAGLYKENGQQLYVNRGFGYIGYGGRIGIWPEITIFTLQQA